MSLLNQARRELTTYYTEDELLTLVKQSGIRVDDPAILDILTTWEQANNRPNWVDQLMAERGTIKS